MVFSMILYDIIQYHIDFSLSCAIFMPYHIRYHTHIIRNLLWYQNYMILNMILPMIWPSDISITWYHSHVISQILWCYSLYHGTCAAGWHGLGAPGAKRSTSESSGLTIANLNVLGSQWGRGLSWTATAWIQRMDFSQSHLPSFKFKVEIFKLDVTSSSNLWTAVHHWHICIHLAQVGHLVVAGLPHCAQDWVTDSHTGLPWSPPCRLGFTVSPSLTPAVTDRWPLCTSVVCLSSCTSLHER
jgi:hypothetical protein